MSQQIQKQKATTQQADEAAPVEAKDTTNQPLTEAVEDILDEIDGVLEANAEEFVQGFVQKGGE